MIFLFTMYLLQGHSSQSVHFVVTILGRKKKYFSGKKKSIEYLNNPEYIFQNVHFQMDDPVYIVQCITISIYYRSFTAHTGRILAMKALLTKTQRIFLSSSADRTIKVKNTKTYFLQRHSGKTIYILS